MPRNDESESSRNDNFGLSRGFSDNIRGRTNEYLSGRNPAAYVSTSDASMVSLCKLGAVDEVNQ
jgi:hypothetical protein